MEDNTTRKRKANLQCPPTLSARGDGGWGGAEKSVMLAIMKVQLFTEQWPSRQGAGFPIHESHVQNHQVSPNQY